MRGIYAALAIFAIAVPAKGICADHVFVGYDKVGKFAMYIDKDGGSWSEGEASFWITTVFVGSAIKNGVTYSKEYITAYCDDMGRRTHRDSVSYKSDGSVYDSYSTIDTYRVPPDTYGYNIDQAACGKLNVSGNVIAHSTEEMIAQANTLEAYNQK
jgi:hypothetical protein